MPSVTERNQSRSTGFFVRSTGVNFATGLPRFGDLDHLSPVSTATSSWDMRLRAVRSQWRADRDRTGTMKLCGQLWLARGSPG